MVVRGCPRPGHSMAALQRDAFGFWTAGVLLPASPTDITCPVRERSEGDGQAVQDALDASPPRSTCPVNLPSFVRALGCLVPCSPPALFEAFGISLQSIPKTQWKTLRTAISRAIGFCGS